MAITKVRVQINGVWTNCTKNTAGKWTCNPAAPSLTSYNEDGGYYPVTVEITNDAGTVATYNASSPDIGTSLRLVVKEKIKPTITLVSPTDGTRTTNNKPTIKFKVVDETGGSGINQSTVTLNLDSTAHKHGGTGMSVTAITNGYEYTYTPSSALSDGNHTISISVSDNDGNAATVVSAAFVVDVTKPVLTITSPTANLITNQAAQTLKGTTNDVTSSPVTITATLNGTSVGTITVGSDGTFSKAITLKEGSNTIVVTAKDAAGNTTTVTRTVSLDTSVPQLNSATISPNPANASASVQIVLDIT